MVVILEPSFDFAITPNGRVFLFIRSRVDIASRPFMVFDKKKTLALFRDRNEIIELTCIPKKLLRILQTTKQIGVLEMDESNKITYRYTTDLFLDSNLRKKLKKEKQVIC